MKRFMLALLMTILPSICHAQFKKPLLDINRLAVAGGVNYDWYEAEAPFAEKTDVVPSVYVAYVGPTALSLYGTAKWSVKNEIWRLSPGLHLRNLPGSDHIQFAVTYDYYLGREARLPKYRHEWDLQFIYTGRIPLTQIVYGAVQSYTVDNKIWKTSVGFSFPIFLGKDS